MEKQILQAMINDRGTYDLFERIGSVDDFSPIGRTVCRAIKEYYDVDPDIRSCDSGIIESRLFARIVNNKHEAPIREYLRSLPRGVSVPNVERSLRDLRRASVDSKLSLALANGAPEEEKQRLWKEREQAGTETARAVSESRLVDVLDTTDLTEEKGNVEYIKLWPKQLNDRLDGGCLAGHHVLVFARPEAGKTLFAINLVAGFLFQKLNVLYVGNEEPAADIRDRIRGRLLKVSKRTIRDEPKRAAAALRGADTGHVVIQETATFAAVRKCLDLASDVDVLVIDQIRNMRISSDSRTAELEAAGIEARAIAKEFNILVVSVTQAGNSADNKIYLEMSDVDSSKTGLPASADLMIGLGADEVMKANGMLGISLPKNKLSGLHDKFTVSVNYATGEMK
jgi:archaellum biogenesis ATPase FlaH